MSEGDTIILKRLFLSQPPIKVLLSGVGFLTGNDMSSVVAFVSRFSRHLERLKFFFFFHAAAAGFLFFLQITVTRDRRAARSARLRTVLSVGLSIIILILTINQIHGRLLE